MRPGRFMGLANWRKRGPARRCRQMLPTCGGTGCHRTGPTRYYGSRTPNRDTKWETVSGKENVHAGAHAVRCVSSGGEADTSLYADVTLKPDTEYRLAGWVKGRGLRGRISFNDHINRLET